jgi:hypothetical protein
MLNESFAFVDTKGMLAGSNYMSWLEIHELAKCMAGIWLLFLRSPEPETPPENFSSGKCWPAHLR